MTAPSRIVTKTGQALLNDPILNKDLAFSTNERAALGLTSLLPPAIRTLAEQVAQLRQTLDAAPTPLDKHIILRDVQDRNETLFYATLASDLHAMLPLVYTPAVGAACQNFSRIFKRPRGLFLAWPDRAQMTQTLANPAYDDVRVIVVTDGARILGLGDQGAGGMGIPIGKLSLYTACAGIAPEHTLPITLDCGTDNQALLDDPAYIGWRHPRLRGAEYDAFIETFVTAVQARFPNILLQWEDFAGPTAAPILDRYRDRLCSFNDDIQGTASVALGAILSAQVAQKSPLHEQSVLMVGAGSAGVGIAKLLMQAMIEEGASPDTARARFFMTDKDGLLTDDRTGLDAGQALFARPAADWPEAPADLAALVERARPTILIGVSGQAGLFNEHVIRTMAEHCARPIVFPLSNPTTHAEATPEQVMAWTDGRALVSTGSPFPALTRHGRAHRVDQTNNAYIFPGLGLGVLAIGATRVTETMFMAAARALAALSPLHTNPDGNLLPPVEQLRDVAISVARDTALQARADNVCPDFDEAGLDRLIAEAMWSPVYRDYTVAG